MNRAKKQQRGFSLIELIVVLVLISIISAIAIPSYQSITRGNGVTSATNTMLGSLQLARSEAVIRRAGVTACPSTDGSTCAAGTSWNLGGVVKLTNSAEVIRVIPAPASGVNVSGNKVDYRGDGTSTGSTLTINHSGGGASKTVKVNLIGQACGGSSCS